MYTGQQHWSVVSLNEENYQEVEHLFGDARRFNSKGCSNARMPASITATAGREAKAQDSATGTGTPMQIVVQYHPSDAMAFKQAAQA